MRSTTNLFLVDGYPLLTPNTEVTFNYEDIDAADTGRDEAGYMHRHVVRRKVGKWTLDYGTVTEEEKQYMETIFDGRDTFQFTRPGRIVTGTPETTECYRSKLNISWVDTRTGKWKNYKINIIEC